MTDQVIQQPSAGDMQAADPTEEFQTPAAQRQAHTLDIVRAGLSDHYASHVASVDILRVHQRVYSRVLDCDLHLADGARHRVMIKLYEPIGTGTKARLANLVSDDFAITTRLHHHFQSNPRFRVPVPLFHSPEDLVIVTEFMPGIQLQEKLIARAGWFPGQATVQDLELNCRSAGEWLREFQKATLDSAPDGLNLGRMREMIAMRLQWLVDDANIPIDASKRARLLAHFDSEVSSLRPEDRAVSSVHGDFFPGNVLVEADRVVGIDFAMCRVGSIAADPSYFMFQLETLTYKPQYRRNVIRSLQQAFLQGYDPMLSAEHYFNSSPIVRMHFILHNVMRLAGMSAPKTRLPLKKRMHNWGVAIAVSKRLLANARPR